MRHIKKDGEPRELTAFKAKGGTKYEGENLDKSPIQTQLLKEQGGLCAYCMSRIKAEPGKTPKMGIEHLKDRATHPGLQLDYNNMLGVCLGGKKKRETGKGSNKKENLHCDQSKDSDKGHFELRFMNPLSEHVTAHYTFADGYVLPNDSDQQKLIEAEIEQALNLNNDFLVENRRKLINELKDRYTKDVKGKGKRDKTIFLNKMLRFYKEPNKNGQLQPYCEVAIQWLESKK
ncbi:hypothetical protein FUAX_28580 [Fulvitalea axinellae]|uniref:TIGR02646 family protein n=1 Tax=Fulvitalea axinellae TaxID=1182444 RepID=A0AAU9CMX9_9BACT|nr:hypothetical protein FUAX_28580 [Fulvitalea axinellae]